MSSVSHILKNARETRGITLDEVARRTYIKLPYLVALEEGSVDALPAAVFVHGYIRQYAKLLGLNAADLVQRYQQEVHHAPPPLVLAPARAMTENETESRDDDAADQSANGRRSNGSGSELGNPGKSIRFPGLGTALDSRYDALAGDGLSIRAHGDNFPGGSSLNGDGIGRSNGYRNGNGYHEHLDACPPQVAGGLDMPLAANFERTAPRSQPLERMVTVNPDPTHSAGDGEEIATAKVHAQRIIAEAQREAQILRRDAEKYASQVLAELDADISKALSIIRNGRQIIQQRRRPPSFSTRD